MCIYVRLNIVGRNV